MGNYIYIAMIYERILAHAQSERIYLEFHKQFYKMTNMTF